MARVDQLPKGAVTPLRLVLVLVFLLSLSGFLLYFFAVPLRMLYWGGAPRCSPAPAPRSPPRRPAARARAAARSLAGGSVRPPLTLLRCAPHGLQCTRACGPWCRSRTC